jgi:hypothetical protein
MCPVLGPTASSLRLHGRSYGACAARRAKTLFEWHRPLRKKETTPGRATPGEESPNWTRTDSAPTRASVA